MPKDVHLVLQCGHVTEQQGGVDGLGLPQQPEEETTRVSNNKPGTAIPCLSQLPPPSPDTSTIVRNRTTTLLTSDWVGYNLKEVGIERT